MREISLAPIELTSLSKEIYSKGGALYFRIRGSSMYPFIRDGDILAIQPVEITDLKLGDIVAFQSTSQNLVAHRLIQKQFQKGDIFLRTRGDAAWELDDYISKKQIVGRVFKIKRGQKVILINSHFWRLVSIIWTKCSSLSPLLLKLFISIRRLCSRTTL